MRTPFIAGNWKMHKTCREAIQLATAVKALVMNVHTVEVAIAPPFTALQGVGQVLDQTSIALAAQHLFWEEEGAYTGEISPFMLRDVGCQYVIIGHSERRRYFGETNATVNKRLHAALACGLRPICCVGETLEEREANQTFAVLERQLTEGLHVVPADRIEALVVAYEPIWAIGTGKTAEPEQANAAHAFMRFIEYRVPSVLEQSRRILAIPSKKTDTRLHAWPRMETVRQPRQLIREDSASAQDIKRCRGAIGAPERNS